MSFGLQRVVLGTWSRDGHVLPPSWNVLSSRQRPVSLGFKEFLFRMAQTIISMFALRTRAAHLLLRISAGHSLCALIASRTWQVSAESDDY